jgi:hypothetical protein
MPTYIRALISGHLSTDPKKDKLTNTVYFVAPNSEVLQVDWSKLANDLADQVVLKPWMNGADTINVRMYSLEDPEPRQPKADVTKPKPGVTGLGPRQIALVLSFRGAGTRARDRGRIYLGQYGSAAMGDRPSDALLNGAITVADALAGLGGVDIDWSVFSPTTYLTSQNYGQSFKPVQLAWVDDRWDVQRSRAIEPTKRVSKAFSE